MSIEYYISVFFENSYQMTLSCNIKNYSFCAWSYIIINTITLLKYNNIIIKIFYFIPINYGIIFMKSQSNDIGIITIFVTDSHVLVLVMYGYDH